MKLTDVVTALATLLAALASGIYAYFSFQLLKATKEQASLAREALQESREETRRRYTASLVFKAVANVARIQNTEHAELLIDVTVNNYSLGSALDTRLDVADELDLLRMSFTFGDLFANDTRQIRKTIPVCRSLSFLAEDDRTARLRQHKVQL